MGDRRAILGSQLRAMLPCDDREHGFLARMLGLLEGSEAPFSPEQLDPGHFTASAFVLSPERDALLLIYHSRLERWLQPGGHVDGCDPDLLATARRECREEIGRADLILDRDGIFDVDIHTIPPTARRPQHEHFDVRYLLRSPTRLVRAGSDALDVRWVPLRSVAVHEANTSVMRAVQKLT
jgi:8-oxo-dGTP pyrophosphatase MutT (NUDIX family)